MKNCSIRLEVLVNDVRRCIAGMEGPGTLDATIVRHRSKRGAQPEDVYLHVGCLCSSTDSHGLWINEEVSVGDEIVIRLLPPGEFDPPPPPSEPTNEA